MKKKKVLFTEIYVVKLFSSSLTKGQNKLACLSVAKLVQSSLIFASKAGTYRSEALFSYFPLLSFLTCKY